MFERTSLLLGEDGLEKLQKSKVLVIGVGGVGSIAVEALARSGISEIVIVDNDTIALSNLNRQVQTNMANVGKSKVLEMVNHIKRINPEINIVAHEIFFDKDVDDIFEGVDFVIDAIDTLGSKADLIEKCMNLNIPFISSLGMGNKIDPTKVEQTTLDKTSYDPVAKILRKMCRDRHLELKKVPVVFTSEKPIVQNKIVNENGETRKQKMPPASMFLVPPTAGLACAAYCIQFLVNK